MTDEPLTEREREIAAKLQAHNFIMLLLGEHPHANTQITHAFSDGIEISTILSTDLGWETAILLPNGGTHPVERYDSKEAAAVGHQQWIESIPYLDSIDDIGYPELEHCTTERVILRG